MAEVLQRGCREDRAGRRNRGSHRLEQAEVQRLGAENSRCWQKPRFASRLSGLRCNDWAEKLAFQADPKSVCRPGTAGGIPRGAAGRTPARDAAELSGRSTAASRRGEAFRAGADRAARISGTFATRTWRRSTSSRPMSAWLDVPSRGLQERQQAAQSVADDARHERTAGGWKRSSCGANSPRSRAAIPGKRLLRCAVRGV